VTEMRLIALWIVPILVMSQLSHGGESDGADPKHDSQLYRLFKNTVLSGERSAFEPKPHDAQQVTPNDELPSEPGAHDISTKFRKLLQKKTEPPTLSELETKLQAESDVEEVAALKVKLRAEEHERRAENKKIPDPLGVMIETTERSFKTDAVKRGTGLEQARLWKEKKIALGWSAEMARKGWAKKQEYRTFLQSEVKKKSLKTKKKSLSDSSLLVTGGQAEAQSKMKEVKGKFKAKMSVVKESEAKHDHLAAMAATAVNKAAQNTIAGLKKPAKGSAAASVLNVQEEGKAPPKQQADDVERQAKQIAGVGVEKQAKHLVGDKDLKMPSDLAKMKKNLADATKAAASRTKEMKKKLAAAKAEKSDAQKQKAKKAEKKELASKETKIKRDLKKKATKKQKQELASKETVMKRDLKKKAAKKKKIEKRQKAKAKAKHAEMKEKKLTAKAKKPEKDQKMKSKHTETKMEKSELDYKKATQEAQHLEKEAEADLNKVETIASLKKTADKKMKAESHEVVVAASKNAVKTSVHEHKQKASAAKSIAKSVQNKEHTIQSMEKNIHDAARKKQLANAIVNDAKSKNAKATGKAERTAKTTAKQVAAKASTWKKEKLAKGWKKEMANKGWTKVEAWKKFQVSEKRLKAKRVAQAAKAAAIKKAGQLKERAKNEAQAAAKMLAELKEKAEAKVKSAVKAGQEHRAKAKVDAQASIISAAKTQAKLEESIIKKAKAMQKERDNKEKAKKAARAELHRKESKMKKELHKKTAKNNAKMHHKETKEKKVEKKVKHTEAKGKTKVKAKAKAKKQLTAKVEKKARHTEAKGKTKVKAKVKAKAKAKKQLTAQANGEELQAKQSIKEKVRKTEAKQTRTLPFKPAKMQTSKLAYSILFLLIGLVSLFAGYRFYMAMLFVGGFVLTAVITDYVSQFNGLPQSTCLWVVPVTALLFAVMTILIYQLGVFILGALWGVVLALLLNGLLFGWVMHSNIAIEVVMLLSAIVMGVLCSHYHHHSAYDPDFCLCKVLIYSKTATIGAYMILRAVGFMAGGASAAFPFELDLALMSQKPYGLVGYMFGTIVLALVGILVQAKYTHKGEFLKHTEKTTTSTATAEETKPLNQTYDNRYRPGIGWTPASRMEGGASSAASTPTPNPVTTPVRNNNTEKDKNNGCCA